MFFLVSKLLWGFTAPGNFLFLLTALGVLGLFTRFCVAARRLLVVTVLCLLVCGFGPVGYLLTQALENRFPRADVDPATLTGIIVLGGATDEVVTLDRDQVTLTEAGTRFTQAVLAARRFPNARFIFTGGSGLLAGFPGMSEAQVARRFFAEMGLAPERIELEDRSRNTWQNAVFTRDIVHPQNGQRWLLVTSAQHMPRSMGIFRQAGFDVLAWPSGYHTVRDGGLLQTQPLSAGLGMTDSAMREWIGLVAYRLVGYTNALFPAP